VNDLKGTFALARNFICDDNSIMTAKAVIEEIKQLPREEQSHVIRFVHELERKRQFTPEELGELTRQMVESKDPAEAQRLEEELVRGFYGNEPHA
jgi:hypothetical protein